MRKRKILGIDVGVSIPERMRNRCCLRNALSIHDCLAKDSPVAVMSVT